MVIKKSQATPIKANDVSIIWDYPLPTEDTGISYQNLNGKLPEKGWYRNTVCHEMFFIISGSAQITIENQAYEVSQGDLVIIKPGQKHFGTYNNCSMITITSPNWYEKQCEIVEE